jgi:hypothetical protein
VESSELWAREWRGSGAERQALGARILAPPLCPPPRPSHFPPILARARLCCPIMATTLRQIFPTEAVKSGSE